MFGGKQSYEILSFGTDGWRDTTDAGFTLENVRRLTQAICDYLKESYSSPLLVVGYDTRYHSKDFAREAARVAAANGIQVFLTCSFSPTPVVSFATVGNQASGAIIITASHNPARYNGLKFKTRHGGSASPQVTQRIEQFLIRNLNEGRKAASISFDDAKKRRLIRLFDPKSKYFNQIFSLIDKNLIKESKLKIVIDPMYGATQGYLAQVLKNLNCQVVEVHNQVDPSFNNINPEPIPPHISELQKEVKNRCFDLGLAFDGDGDRIGAVDENGNFVDSHQIFALLLRYLVKERGWTGKVIKTVSVTQMIDLLAEKYNLPLFVTPIGFKHICQYILEGDVLIGGEESGGIGIKGHIPERDGMLIGLLLIETVAACKKSLGELLKSLREEIGCLYYGRLDLEVDALFKKSLALYFTKRKPKQILGKKVIKTDELDGHKFLLEDGSWLMLRASGTEKVVRIYAEASASDRVRALLKKGKEILTKVEKDYARGKDEVAKV